MDNLQAYCIHQLLEGGYVVTAIPLEPGMIHRPMFACKDLEDALRFVRLKFEPAQLVNVEDSPKKDQ